MWVPNMAVQQAEGGWQCFCPHHQALAWLAPSMWFGIVWKQARFWGRISVSGKKMRHRCGIFWLGWLMDVGRYEGVAPSMWAFAAWFWRMSGSCVIYVPKNDFFLQSSALWQFATLLGPGKRTPPSPPKKSFFLSFPKETWHLVGSVFRGEPKWKIGTALVSPIFSLNIKLPFWDIDGATPTHSPKSGCKCPHTWRNSLIPPDIHQPT